MRIQEEADWRKIRRERGSVDESIERYFSNLEQNREDNDTINICLHKNEELILRLIALKESLEQQENMLEK